MKAILGKKRILFMAAAVFLIVSVLAAIYFFNTENVVFISPARYEVIIGEKNSYDENAPAIIKISEGVKPGDAVSIFGEYFTGDVKVKMLEPDIVINPVQVDEEGQFLRFIYPADLSPGIYTLKVSNDGGISWSGQSRILNAPDGQWASDEGMYTGMVMDLFGRNLHAAHGITEVRFVDAETGKVSNVREIKLLTPYRISFVTPRVTPGNQYYIQVRVSGGGLGSEWFTAVEYPNEDYIVLTAVEAPNDETALAMNISWAGTFNWDNVIDVTKAPYNADHTGTTDATAAIQQAVDAAHEQGGGVAYLPEGKYKISSIRMKENTIVKGDGADKTLLEYEGVWINDYSGLNINLVSMFTNDHADVGQTGVTGVKAVISPDIDSELRVMFAQFGFYSFDTNVGLRGNAKNIFVFRCEIDFGLENQLHRGIAYLGEGPFFTAENKITVVHLADGSPVKKYEVYRDNAITFSTNALFSYANKFIFTGNTLDAVLTRFNANIYQHGVFAGKNMNQYIGDNFINDQMYNMHQSEAFATDAAVTIMTAETIVEASADSVTIDCDYWLVAPSWIMPDESSWQLCIQKGTGLGQIRTIDKIEELGGADNGRRVKITLNRPWDVVPDTTSLLSVATYHNNVVFESNTITNAVNVAACLFQTTYNSVVARNKGYNTAGGWVMGGIVLPLDKGSITNEQRWSYSSGNSSFFNQFRENEFYGVDAMAEVFNIHTGQKAPMFNTFYSCAFLGEYGNSLTSGYDVNAGFWSDTISHDEAWAVTLYGNEFRNNLIDPTAEYKGAGMFIADAAYWSVFANPGGVGSKGALFDGNEARNVNTGIIIGNGLPSTRGVFVKDMICNINVDTTIIDKGW